MPVVFYINFILTWVYNNSKVYNDLINVKNMRTVLLSHCKQHYLQNITRETCAQREKGPNTEFFLVRIFPY